MVRSSSKENLFPLFAYCVAPSCNRPQAHTSMASETMDPMASNRCCFCLEPNLQSSAYEATALPMLPLRGGQLSLIKFKVWS